MSKSFLPKLFTLLLSMYMGLSVQAQSTYPNKAINFIVPYGAGGGADSRSRQIAQGMSVLLKQPIVVEIGLVRAEI